MKCPKCELPLDFSFFSKFFTSNILDFWRYLEVLEGFKSSGRLVRKHPRNYDQTTQKLTIKKQRLFQCERSFLEYAFSVRTPGTLFLFLFECLSYFFKRWHGAPAPCHRRSRQWPSPRRQMCFCAFLTSLGDDTAPLCRVIAEVASGLPQKIIFSLFV